MKDAILKKLFYIDKDDKKIYTLYALRFILFIFIFAHHCYKHLQIDFLRQPALGVSGFIILSGFLNGYIYKNKYTKVSIKEMFNFSIKRIKKFYPLHIIMLLITIPNSGIFNTNSIEKIAVFFKKLICNVTLTQSYINNENYYFSFNGVTWYLSTYLFLTLLTIPLLFLIDKINSKKHSKTKFAFISLLLLGFTFLLVYIVRTNQLNEGFWLYVFPPARLSEYIIGMIVGNIIKDKKINFKYDKIVFTILEVLSICVLIGFMYGIKLIPNISLVVDKKINQWIVPMILIISIFSYQKGLISYILKSKLLVFLGEASMNMFMIHQPLIIYMNKAIGTPIHHKLYGLFLLVLVIVLSGAIQKTLDARKNKEIKEQKLNL